MSTCEQIQELISRMLDEELSREETTQVEEHLRVCPDCAALYAAFDRLSAALREDLEEPPVSLHENIMAGVRRESLAEKQRFRLSKPMRSFLAAAACLALLAGVSFLLRQPLKRDAADSAATAAVESIAQEPEAAMFRISNDENGAPEAEDDSAAALSEESAPEAPAAAPAPAPDTASSPDAGGGAEQKTSSAARSVVLADREQWTSLLGLLGLSETAEAASVMDAGAAPDLEPLYEIIFEGETLLIFSGEGGLYAASDVAGAPVPARCGPEELESFLSGLEG